MDLSNAITVRFFGAVSTRFFRILKESLWDKAVLATSIIYIFGNRLITERWEVVVPLIGGVGLVISVYGFQTAREISKEFREKANPRGFAPHTPLLQVPRLYRVRLYSLAGLLVVIWGYLSFQVWTVSAKHEERPWCYAFFYHFYPPGIDARYSLGIINPTEKAAHNVAMTAIRKEKFPDEATPEERRRRDLAMADLHRDFLQVVLPRGAGTWMMQQWVYDADRYAIYQISFTPEDGDSTIELIRVEPFWQCILSVTRGRDGKVLLHNITPPRGTFVTGADVASPDTWKSCQ